MRTVLVSLLLVLTGSITQAQMPNRAFDESEVGFYMSTEMSRGYHVNQPAVISGRLLLTGNGEHSFWDIRDPYRPRFITAFESPFNED